ncbi:Glyoxalase/bleomycin resistance protein/dioxygenase [Xylanimonas cellulosilytica DSM 15894]|uniref:Glyoxalase/bleomycin resistance protein/dioxygenase n=1 Tax=Xylanimonas cellulosilytica (strain DSM 15894 / JCM 12276 / CECT 5975 / KCTC 9989 / LMG 20990 / NBRC 107835 / XIL07) TaxID=446471 RepID=D1BVA5_XYLCX|nr:VOC family protein [Xylanimonas cellulosilytica]ACZ29376.1 Glyoxalase/bleomycin resistance protein/dioxygenase [Xylanimonas cellulosilytica DSM 15894]
MSDLLPAGTGMRAVTLHVDDLDGMTAYYRDALLLDELAVPETAGLTPGDRAETVVLGRAGVPAVVLRRTPGLPRPARGAAGLFHTAIVYPDRAALAATVASVGAAAPGTYVGSADHLVSEAFYFTDPEGNGVELYYDRPRDTWAWDAGQVRMDTLWLDPNAYLTGHLPRDAQDQHAARAAAAVVGHVHLQVGDVAAARAFYVDALGLAPTAALPGALFVAAGGYHHHLAVNTWSSRGAGPRASTLGLATIGLEVPTADDAGALRDRLRHAGIAVADDGATLRFDDPWRNHLEVAVAA